MKRFFLTLSFLTLAVTAWSQSQTQPKPEPAQADLLMGLKPGAGRELVLANCLPCHSTAIVAANHMKREQWDKIVTTMQTRNGMWPLADETRKRLLDYLETAQRVEDQFLDAGKETPWAAPLYRPNPIW